MMRVSKRRMGATGIALIRRQAVRRLLVFPLRRHLDWRRNHLNLGLSHHLLSVMMVGRFGVSIQAQATERLISRITRVLGPMWRPNASPALLRCLTETLIRFHVR